tara:strand:+ start:2508 stop:3713 length:1206 start_codon:yes stop_codon:yes gene_type:complete
MSELTNGQLVFVKDNPGLGPARVLEFDSRYARLEFFWLSADRLVDKSQLEPYRLSPGTPVELETDDPELNLKRGTVTKHYDNGSEQIYEVSVVGRPKFEIPEQLLRPAQGDFNDPFYVLESRSWDRSSEHTLKDLQLRSRMREHLWRTHDISEGIPSLTGARIKPLAHQIYAVRRVLLDSKPRFVLADEVGLGKTIEAGLIIAALTSKKPKMRVLVIAPGSMSRQWFRELYLRFGAVVYKHLDLFEFKRLATNESDRLREFKNILSDHRRIILSTTLLEHLGTEYLLADQPLMPVAWDMVVIDEAHQHPPDTPLYKFFHTLTLPFNTLTETGTALSKGLFKYSSTTIALVLGNRSKSPFLVNGTLRFSGPNALVFLGLQLVRQSSTLRVDCKCYPYFGAKL